MKKQLKALFLFAAMMLVGAALTACSSDEIEPYNNNETVGNGVTEFTAETAALDATDAKGMALGEGTRSSLDTAYHFFWESGDKIFVRKGGEWKPSSVLNLAEKKNFAKFTVDATFTSAEQSVDVVYTGTNSTKADEVTIASAQAQKAWNVSTHLGSSGDCGTATSTRNAVTGAYTFTLTHKASYLILYPYLDASQSGYNLTSIDIESESGTELAGTFAFGAGNTGITGAATSGGTNKITLTLGTGGAGLPLLNTTPTKADGNHCYVVLRPGEYYLNITYHLQNATNATDMLDVVQSLGYRTFSPNGVSIIACNVSDTQGSSHGAFDFTYETYYAWDAEKWAFEGVGWYPLNNKEGAGAGNSAGSYDSAYPGSTVNRTGNSVPTTANLSSNSDASYSAKDMPCYNAATWYLKAGHYYDESAEWTMRAEQRNRTVIYRRTGGVWLKKWEYIEGKPEGSTIFDCPSSSGVTNSGVTNDYMISGKPSDDEIYKYFFLPIHTGYYALTSNPFTCSLGSAQQAYYWLSSPVPDGNACTINFSSDGKASAYQGGQARSNRAQIAGHRPDGSLWFQ